jgi:hypothetical protein
MENDAKKTAHSYTPAIKFSQEFVTVIVDAIQDNMGDLSKPSEDRMASMQRELNRAENFLAGALMALHRFGGEGKP